MILIAGIPTESPVEMATDAAEKAGIDYVLFNQREAHNYNLSLKCINNRFNGIININGREFDLSSFSGIYLRMMDYYFLPEIRNKVFHYIGDTLAGKTISTHVQLLNWLETTNIRVFNKPWDMLSNMSKPYQAQIIAKAGFKIPATCISSDPDSIKKFLLKYKSLIYKSISSARSIVKELDKTGIQELERVKYLPTQFQKKLRGHNIRVHVVGDVLFATKAESEVVDYRYARREEKEVKLTSFKLPSIVQKNCFRLAKELNLMFCGIDLFLTSRGEYYCFEVNPSPGYSYYQQQAGQNIAEAIVKWLEYGTAK